MAKVSKIATYKRIFSSEYISDKKTGDIDKFINGRNHYFFFAARLGILSIIDALKFKPGDIVLLPSILPEGVLLPFKKRNIRYIFYEVNDQLEPEIGNLINLLNNNSVKILLVIHYFGKEVNIQTLRKSLPLKDTLIVEDCAHCFHSESQFGTNFVGYEGDITLYSLNKFLPIPDGSLIVFNNKELINRLSLNIRNQSFTVGIAFLFSWLSIFFKSLHVQMNGIWIMDLFSKVFYALYYKILCSLNKPFKISNYSKRIITSFYLQQWSFERNKNFIIINDELSNNFKRLITSNLKGITAPGFPIIFNNIDVKNEVKRLLKSKGIEVLSYKSRWFYKDKLISQKNTVTNKSFDGHLLLPINTYIDKKQLQLMISLLNENNK